MKARPPLAAVETPPLFGWRPHTVRSARVALLSASLLGAFGCTEEKKPVKASPDAGPQDRASIENAKLAAAVRAAASSSSSSKPTSGPPEGGILAQGVADTQAKAFAPPKVELGSDGAEPRVSWKVDPERWKGQATLSVGIRLGQNSALPSVDFAVSFSQPKADGDAPPEILAKLDKASPSAQQLGQLPADAKKEIGLLKGSEVRFRRHDASLGSPIVKLAKGANPEVGRVAEGVGESLLLLTVPPPPKPVGVGAFWIAGSRETIGGMDAVLYRLYRVKSLSKDKITLTVEAHAYAADGNAPVEGAPKDLVLGQFQCEGTAELELTPGDPVAEKGKSTLKVGLLFRPSGNPQGRGGTSQTVTDATLTRVAK